MKGDAVPAVELSKEAANKGTPRGLMAVLVDPRTRRWLPLLQLIIAVVVIAILPGAVSDTFYLYSLTLGAIYLTAVIGLDFTVYAGAVSMGTAAFM